MAQFLGPSFFQANDASSVPYAGGKLYVYESGTTTPIALFSDEGLTTPAANPLVADAAGVFPIAFMDETTCKTILTDADDQVVYTRDPVITIGFASNVPASAVSFDGTASGLASENVQDAIDEISDLMGGYQEWESTSDGVLAKATSTNAGAAAGPLIELYRNSASPANSDVLGGTRHTGMNASAVKTIFSEDQTVITDVTNGSEDGKRVIRTMVNGNLADRLHIGAGAWMDGATDPGTGKINATEVQQSGTAIRPLVLMASQATTSGTAVNFTDIPSWVNKITVNFYGTGAGGNICLRLGTSGGLITSGYNSTMLQVYNPNEEEVNSYGSSSYFLISGASATGSTVICRHVDYKWVVTSMILRDIVHFSVGSVDLGGTLTQIGLLPSSGSFNAGSASVMYE